MKNILAVAVLLAFVVCVAWAQESDQELSIGSAGVTAYPPLSASTGKYYKVEFQTPQVRANTTLEKAVLEFYVDAESFVRGDFRWLDADSVEHVGYKARTPLVEVYALKTQITGALKADQLEGETAARVPVRVGKNRRVVVDIAPIVRLFMADPTRNRGIMIGSLTGEQRGDFTLRTDAFSDGSRAKIRLEFSPPRYNPGATKR